MLCWYAGKEKSLCYRALVEDGREVMARHRIISQYTIWTIFIVVLSFTSHHLIAEDQKIHSSLPAYTPRKTRIALYPVAFYSGETGAAGGFATTLLFPGYSQQRIPTIGLLGYYTQNGQYSVKLKPELYWSEDRYRFIGKIQYDYRSNSFYGLGNDTNLGDEMRYMSRYSFNQLSLQRMIFRNAYLGVQYQYSSNTHEEDLTSTFSARAQNGVGDEGSSSGVGLLLSFDSRDNNIYPMKGNLLELSALTYQPVIGSDYEYSRLYVEYCNYHTLFTDHVLAFRSVVGITTGNAPFYGMYDLDETLHGFSENRYVDRNMVSVQAEYRMPLFWRLGVAGFVGAGQVADSPGSFSIDRFHPSGGVGLRFALLREDKINLRIDYGRSSDDSSFDINFAENF